MEDLDLESSDTRVDSRSRLPLWLHSNHQQDAYLNWISAREPLYLSTNTDSKDLAFQRWRKFKEAFAPELVERAITEASVALGHKVESCLDPFCGSGTTLLTCQFLGVTPIGIEVNPFLADLTEAKLSQYNKENVLAGLSYVLKKDKGRPKKNALFLEAPPTFVEPGVDGRFLFNKSVAKRIMQIESRIGEISDYRVRRLLRVLLSAVATDVSNVIVSGKGRRYRRNWKSKIVNANSVDEKISLAVERAVEDIETYGDRPQKQYKVFRGDARKLIGQVESADLAVFSPPYPNSFDYTDVYNVELWVGRYLKSKGQNQKLRQATIRSHVQIKRDFTGKLPQSGILTNTLSALRREKGNLWNHHIPAMVGAYFIDMSTVLIELRRRLRSEGRVYMVVGDSRYAGINIPVARILSQLASRLGFKVLSLEPFRSMRSSPQQGAKAELPETLIILEVNSEQGFDKLSAMEMQMCADGRVKFNSRQN